MSRSPLPTLTATEADPLDAIVAVVRFHAPTPISLHDIVTAVPQPTRTLQARLARLVEQGRLGRTGERRWARYSLSIGAQVLTAAEPAVAMSDSALSPAALAAREIVRLPLARRKPVGYQREFLDAYRPNRTSYLSKKEREQLHAWGRQIDEQPAGTFARHVLNRLLIDLSWNSSRLEGNTYSLLDTRRLLELGHEASGRQHQEAQMILNHKDAIEFLVESADEIGFNRYTLLNLHALLANNLLPDSAAEGRLRVSEVGIHGSVFVPLAVPQLVEEAFGRILSRAEAIADPFEQALFAMVHLPYLQPFEDGNKRVSRLAANIPLVRANLAPLSFIDVPREAYTEAILAVYEQNNVALMKDVFLWAYERSAAQYTAVRQSMGEPDPLRLKYREPLRELIGELVRSRVARRDVLKRISAWPKARIDRADRSRFEELAQQEILSLHEGNFARYRIRPSEFRAWWAVWNP